MKYAVTFAICILLALGIMVLGPRWAHAQGLYGPGCDKTPEIFKMLAEKFKESPIGVGINDNGQLVTVFVSEQGTFTIVETSPNNVSCMRSSGVDWMAQKAKILGPET